MVLRVGTDCSGLESPLQALIQLNIPFIHSFSSDNNKWVQKFIKQNYSPENFYLDITSRDHSLLPDIDLYIAGFPCQSFSKLGKRLGMADPRANVMLECIKTIQTKKPRYFILENVKQFASTHNGNVLKFLIDELSPFYKVQYKILNTKDFGIPQNRERIFIIGTPIQQQQHHPFSFDLLQKKEMKHISNYLTETEIKNKTPHKFIFKLNPEWNNTEKYFITYGFNWGTSMENMCPTINTKNQYYLSKYLRYLYIDEMFALQGFNYTTLNFDGICKTQQHKMCGNTISVNVLVAIFKELLA